MGGAGYVLTKVRFALIHRFNCTEHLLRGRFFGDVAVGAGLDDSKDVLLVAVH